MENPFSTRTMNIPHRNKNLQELDTDYLYHLGLDSSMNLREMFGDVKYVCMGGSPLRAEAFASKVAKELGLQADGSPKHIGKNERFSLYKVGPVISVSHGMGMPSVSILLHELVKLLEYAGAKDFSFIRIGTSGGVGVEPGDVVITEEGLNAKLEPTFDMTVLGKTYEFETSLDQELSRRIYNARGEIRALIGKTVGTDDFYEGQGRLDGALSPQYTIEDKMAWLQKIHDAGGRNIEMESTQFAAFCKRAGIPGAIVCAALLNRLDGDQVTSTPSELAEFSDRAQTIVMNFIREDVRRQGSDA